MPRRSHSSRKNGNLKKLFVSVFLAVFVASIFNWIGFDSYVISTNSMTPTLIENDYILVEKFSYGLRLPFTNKLLFNWTEPKVGEIIAFMEPEEVSKKGRVFIKRVAAVEKDIISAEGGRRFAVQKGFVYTLGDNISESTDSRHWGAIANGQILGRVSKIWVSCEKRLGPFCDPRHLREDRIFLSVVPESKEETEKFRPKEFIPEVF